MQLDIPIGKILRPTPEEFADFAGYIDKLEKANPCCGLFKIIPPKQWKPNNMNYEKDIDNLVVSHPIEQNVYGKGGIYELLLIQKKSMRVKDYKKKIQSFDAFTDNQTIENVEETFWRNIGFSPPLYGADIKGSLFDDNVEWDLKNLPSLLSDGLRKKISGVNEPYLYFGSWKTMFGWHKEDMDLYSINYLHYGKPKFWYCLPREEGYKLEKFARQQFPDAFNKCKEYMRHKTIMISPTILKQKIPDLKIHKVIHYPGEFVITMGGSYHAGFNWGFNVAEAVNFALPKWLDILPNAQYCKCMNDTVKIDQKEFLKNLAKKQSITEGSQDEVESYKSGKRVASSNKRYRRNSDIYSVSSDKSRKSSATFQSDNSNIINAFVLNNNLQDSTTTCISISISKMDIQKKANDNDSLAKDLLDTKKNDKIEESSKLLKGSKKIKKPSNKLRHELDMNNNDDFLNNRPVCRIRSLLNENENENMNMDNDNAGVSQCCDVSVMQIEEKTCGKRYEMAMN